MIHNFEQHRPHLLAIAYRLLPPKLRAKFGASDLVQDTLIDAMSSEAAERINPSCQLAWLKRILLNRLCEMIRQFEAQKRSVNREIALNEKSLEFEGNTAEHRFIQQEKYQLLKNAIDRLSGEEQILLSLRYFEDRHWYEVGLELQKSEEAARKQFERILKKLKGYLGEPGD